LPKPEEKTTKTKKQHTSHHNPKELGEKQPPPVQLGGTKSLQLKRLREKQKT
jgi:hypothetical protein